jgi:bifunctional non-homologous end joining protein LigD
MSVDGVLQIDGRDVALSSLDRLMFPASGFTKRDLVAYYLAVGPRLLPHVAGHPVTLRRFPSGLAGPDFFQSRAPSTPPWVCTTTLHFPRSGKTFEAVVIDDLASLMWAVNLSTVEFHPYLGCAAAVDRPTAAVFDLDPGHPAGLRECATVALALRDHLALLGLASVAKTSGSVGLHVYVPLGGDDTYDESKALARAVAGVLRREAPDQVVDVMTRSARPGKVFIDWSQNDPGKSTVAPWSLRGFDPPTVSMPVTWPEVEVLAAGGDARSLVFDVAAALGRLEEADPFDGAPTTQTIGSVVGGRSGP